MASSVRDTVTEILEEWGEASSPSGIAEKLYPLVYQELRDLAYRYLRREKVGHTLQPTALVHEAYMRLVDQSRVKWKGKTHFYAVSAEAMRRILIDYARARGRQKRGGKWQRITLHPGVAPVDGPDLDVLAVHDALEKLAELDPRQARIVEMRFFAGLTNEEVARAIGVSKRTVEADWTHAKAWLRVELSKGET